MIKKLFIISFVFSLLTNSVFASTTSATSTPKKLTDDEIINIWKPYTVRVTCISLDSKGDRKSYSDGSGLLSKSLKGVPVVVTNKHVLYTKNNTLSSYCNIYLPVTKETIKVLKKDYFTSKDKDIANLAIRKPTESITSLLKNDKEVSENCKNIKFDSTENIAILGHPTGSNKLDISVTKGVVTGYEEYFYISSASVVTGYSGGVAISLRDNCYLGIPTYAKRDDLSKSLILDVNKMK